MALIKRNPLLKGASGTLGGTVSYRTVNGKLQMVNLPRKRKKHSKKQQTTINRFTRAIRYAKQAMKDPALKTLYATGITSNKISAYQVAVADSMNSPIVDYIKTPDYTGAIGDVITIKARDDFKVVRVEVKIVSANGKIIEKGDATRLLRKPNIWKYKATAVNPTAKGTVIKIRAFDIPDNIGLGEITLKDVLNHEGTKNTK